MKYLSYFYLALGIALFILVLDQANLKDIWHNLKGLSVTQILIILSFYGLVFCTDTLGWQLSFNKIPLTINWFKRLFIIRLIGEAVSRITPFASMGGQPLKVSLLKKHYGINYQESSVSLVVATTLDLLGLVLFLNVGFYFLLTTEYLTVSYKILSGLGLFFLSLGIILFFLIQRGQFFSRFLEKLTRTQYGKKLEKFLGLIKEVDQDFSRFYTQSHFRFYFAILLGIINWFIGIGEVYYLVHFLGFPISFKSAFMIEAMGQLARNATFFIPSSLGTQDGAFLLVCQSVTGSSIVGVTVSVMRRFREIVWIILGMLFWVIFSFKPISPAIEKIKSID